MSHKHILPMMMAGALALSAACAPHQGNTTEGTTGDTTTDGSTAQGSAQGQADPGHTASDQAGSGPAGAAGSAGMSAGQAGQLSAQDDRFMREAAAGGMAEVALGTLAAQKAPAEDIKQFGQRMVTDHTKANQRLMAIVQQKGATVSQELTGEHKVHHEQLSKATGHDFDRMYLGHMVESHEKTVKIFEQQAAQGSDASLRAFAQETLPTVREHLKLAQQLATAHGAHADHGAHGSTQQ